MLSNQESKLIRKGIKYIAGLDEVGRGSLAGPLVAATVMLKKPIQLEEIKDSKQLTASQREKIFKQYQRHPDIEWRMSFVRPKVIDRINIWQATLLAWRRCLRKLPIQPEFVFVDGSMEIPGLKIQQKAVIRGDEKIQVVAMASIFAKVCRDRLMVKLAKKHPVYQFDQHKGYGTKKHLKLIKKYLPSKIHRKSFEPVFRFLSFRDRVYYVVSRIPSGQTMTYKQVALAVGQPLAYRAVGQALNQNYNKQIPCHRVIRHNGQIGGYNRGSVLKSRLLTKEKNVKIKLNNQYFIKNNER